MHSTLGKHTTTIQHRQYRIDFQTESRPAADPIVGQLIQDMRQVITCSIYSSWCEVGDARQLRTHCRVRGDPSRSASVFSRTVASKTACMYSVPLFWTACIDMHCCRQVNPNALDHGAERSTLQSLTESMSVAVCRCRPADRTSAHGLQHRVALLTAPLPATGRTLDGRYEMTCERSTGSGSEKSVCCHTGAVDTASRSSTTIVGCSLRKTRMDIGSPRATRG